MVNEYIVLYLFIAACQTRIHRAAVKTYHSEVPMNDVFAANRQTSKTKKESVRFSIEDVLAEAAG